jgi:hypothetical protein
MKATNQILESIEDRLRQVKAEIETLTAARAALDTRQAATSRRRPAGVTKKATAPVNGAGSDAAQPAAGETASAREPRQRRRRRSQARASEVVPAGRLERLLSENGGLTTSVLAERTNGDRDQILTLLRELEQAGRVRRTGQRRATRWHAITDEDRIRERAAELEARRKRPASRS